jgi:S-adenosylmethionine:tRNA ribosyltransferase-isomerase
MKMTTATIPTTTGTTTDSTTDSTTGSTTDWGLGTASNVLGPTIAFDVPPVLEANEPPELTLGRRDAVRLMVSRGLEAPLHAHASDLARFLEPGDLVVLNTSATVPAAVDANDHGEYVVVHFSTEMPDSSWLVEVRRPVDGSATQPHFGEFTGHKLELPGGATVLLRERFTGSVRLWVAELALGRPIVDYLEQWGRPIRYRYVPATWPIDAYRNVYADEPGSAEMPSAGRPVTTDVLGSLRARGIGIAPLLLHTGVASLEANELPYPERYRVSRRTAELVNATHERGRRVVAIGTTVVRALETATGTDGVTHPAAGWTDVVITPERGVYAVDGLLTGWHAPEATHLQMLEAVAGRPALQLAYREAVAAGYHWHEFGDSHLLLPDHPRSPASRAPRGSKPRGMT